MSRFVDKFVDSEPESPKDSSVEKRKPRDRPRHFIMGPIFVDLLAKATGISKSAGIVLLALYYQSGLRKRKTVPVPYRTLREWGVTDNTTRSAVRKLADAGIIDVERNVGRSPRATILE